MVKISYKNYKMVVFKNRFFIQPDWLMEILNDYCLKPVDRLIYLCLYQHADVHTGECYPSYSVLKMYTGISNNKSIKQGLDRLVQVGLIEIIKKGYYDKDKKISMSNRYRVRYPYPKNFIMEDIK